MVVEAGIKQFVLNGLWMIFEECRLASDQSPTPVICRPSYGMCKQRMKWQRKRAELLWPGSWWQASVVCLNNSDVRELINQLTFIHKSTIKQYHKPNYIHINTHTQTHTNNIGKSRKSVLWKYKPQCTPTHIYLSLTFLRVHNMLINLAFLHTNQTYNGYTDNF